MSGWPRTLHEVITQRVSSAIFEIMINEHNIFVSRTWPYKVTRRHRSHYHAISYCVPLEPSLYLQPFSRYLRQNISGSRPRPFIVTWRHQSRDQSIRHMSLTICVPFEPCFYRESFREILAPKTLARAHTHTPQVISYSVPCNVLHWKDTFTLSLSHFLSIK